MRQDFRRRVPQKRGPPFFRVLRDGPAGSSAFSLLELLVVVVIIGIIAAMALPSFGKAAERARVRDAKAILATIYSAERIYRLDNNAYGRSDELWTNNHYLSDPNLQTTEWTYQALHLGGPGGFKAIATRQGGGSYNGKTIELTDGFDGQNYAASSTHPMYQ